MVVSCRRHWAEESDDLSFEDLEGDVVHSGVRAYSWSGPLL